MRQQVGMTLLEILVVLVISSFISLLLFQSYSQILNIQYRAAEQVNFAQKVLLQEQWFRQVVSALVPAQPKSEHVFSGDEQQFQGLSLAALDADATVPRVIHWQLIAMSDGTTQLLYQGRQETSWLIMQWNADGRIRYQDDKGLWYPEWPPPQGKVESTPGTIGLSEEALLAALAPKPQLPHAIALHGYINRQAFTWYVPVIGRKSPEIDTRMNF